MDTLLQVSSMIICFFFLKKNLRFYAKEFVTSIIFCHMSFVAELAYTMAMSMKSDVYSFGVLVLEIVMGKHPGKLISSLNAQDQNIDLKDLLDPRLPPPGRMIGDELTLILALAVKCINDDPQPRPTMHYVSQLLESEGS